MPRGQCETIIDHRSVIRRVNVTGNAGSGKSTVSRLLAHALDLELHGLDDIVWQPGWQPTPREERNRRISELTSRPSWVIDGVSGLVRDAADTVIFLDVPRRVALRRCVRRNVPYLWRSRPGLPERCPEALVVPTVVKIIMRFEHDVRPVILSDAEANPGRRFIHVQTPSELDELLVSIGAQPVRSRSGLAVRVFRRRLLAAFSS